MAAYRQLDDFDRKTQRKIEALLRDGEEFLGAIDTFDAFIPRRRTKLVLTDARLIEYRRGFIQESTTDYDLEKISAISFDRGLVRRKLEIEGTGIDETYTVDPDGGRAFANALSTDEPVPMSS